MGGRVSGKDERFESNWSLNTEEENLVFWEEIESK